MSDCPHTLTSHHDDGWWRCSACPAVWLCGEPDHNHFGGQPAPNAPPAPKALDPAPPGTTVIEGEIVPSSTAVASGEVRGIVDTRNALEDYLAELAGSQDDGADMKRSAEEVQQALRQAHARLAAEGLGEKTLGAFAAAIEQAGVVERTADDFIASGDTAAAKVRDTQGAVETHRGVEEASLATTDGGTTEYHRGA